VALPYVFPSVTHIVHAAEEEWMPWTPDAPKICPLAELVIDLGQWEIGEAIGNNVHLKLCAHKEQVKRAAMKIFPFQEGDMSRAQQLFQREIEVMGSVRHPCLVELIGFAIPREGPRFLMPYYEGGSLRDLLSMERPPAWWNDTQKALVVLNIVLGMQALHSEGIIHRDLKPENILFDLQHRARIADFGSCWFCEDGPPPTDPSVTTALYTAPETRKDGYRYDKSVDVYSFGLILYEIVSGKHFTADDTSLTDLYSRLLRGGRPQLPKSFLPFTKRLVELCWDDEPKNRPSFDAIRENLMKEKYKILPDVHEQDVNSCLIMEPPRSNRVHCGTPPRRGPRHRLC
jgi:serine/threonine protein kinase